MTIIKATYEWIDESEIAVTVVLDPSIMSFEEDLWSCALDKARDKLFELDKEIGEKAKLIKMEMIADKGGQNGLYLRREKTIY